MNQVLIATVMRCGIDGLLIRNHLLVKDFKPI